MRNEDRGTAMPGATPARFDPKNPTYYPRSALAWLPKDIGDDGFWSSHYYRDVKPSTQRYGPRHSGSDLVMTPRNKLTAERVRALLDCDPETGTLTWREGPGNPSFNVQWSGKAAGSIVPSTGYLRVMIDGTDQYVHRIIWLHTKGWLPSVDLDHHDGDKTKCAMWNLRVVTEAENNRNRRSPARKTDAPPGAWLNPKTQRYQVNIEVAGKSIYLGAYRDPAAAERAYREAAEEHFGEFAVTRHPAWRAA